MDLQARAGAGSHRHLLHDAGAEAAPPHGGPEPQAAAAGPEPDRQLERRGGPDPAAGRRPVRDADQPLQAAVPARQEPALADRAAVVGSAACAAHSGRRDRRAAGRRRLSR
jgi:hypothetical protein